MFGLQPPRHISTLPKPVRLGASTSRLQFPCEQTLLTDVSTSHLGQQETPRHE